MGQIVRIGDGPKGTSAGLPLVHHDQLIGRKGPSRYGCGVGTCDRDGIRVATHAYILVILVFIPLPALSIGFTHLQDWRQEILRTRSNIDPFHNSQHLEITLTRSNIGKALIDYAFIKHGSIILQVP